MDVQDTREFVSAAIHGVALVAFLPAIVALVRRAWPDRAAVSAVSVYSAGLVACLAASTACHASSAVGIYSMAMVKADHMAIYLLIAGTYTPIVAALLPKDERRATLACVWLAAVLGIALDFRAAPLPPPVATGLYLAMGWGGLWCLMRIDRTLSRREDRGDPDRGRPLQCRRDRPRPAMADAVAGRSRGPRGLPRLRRGGRCGPFRLHLPQCDGWTIGDRGPIVPRGIVLGASGEAGGRSDPCGRPTEAIAGLIL